jgi:uncharacterized protein (TIGR03435 family)
VTKLHRKAEGQESRWTFGILPASISELITFQSAAAQPTSKTRRDFIDSTNYDKSMFRTTLLTATIALSLNAATPPKFAAASIHRQAPDDNSFFVRLPSNGGFSATGATARLTVMLAWDLQDSQIAGGPAWFATDRFVIEAKSDDGLPHSPPETREMLQNMLAERFALRTHHEMREGTAYVLTVAKNGSKLKQSQTQSTNVRVGTRSIQLEGAPLSRLAQLLSGVLERPVIDRTGLEGTYDASLLWSDTQLINNAAGVTVPKNADPDQVSIFSAIHDQLGLNLVSRRAPIDTLVIDRIDPPSPN